MEIWIDAQLSPSLALWINHSFKGITAKSVRVLGLRDARDEDIFLKARSENVVIMSKDSDFVKLLEHFGPPPKVIWITSGNTSNAKMREILTNHFPDIIDMFNRGERLVEIAGQ
jgi:predicted nuclease of predicted toxin-antitoxin system